MEDNKDNFTKATESSLVENSPAMSASSAATAAAPARDATVHEEGAQLMLSKLVNERIREHQNLSISFQGKDVTVLGLRNDGIRGRDEYGADVLVPYEWSYVQELFEQLI